MEAPFSRQQLQSILLLHTALLRKGRPDVAQEIVTAIKNNLPSGSNLNTRQANYQSSEDKNSQPKRPEPEYKVRTVEFLPCLDMAEHRKQWDAKQRRGQLEEAKTRNLHAQHEVAHSREKNYQMRCKEWEAKRIEQHQKNQQKQAQVKARLQEKEHASGQKREQQLKTQNERLEASEKRRQEQQRNKMFQPSRGKAKTDPVDRENQESSVRLTQSTPSSP